MNYIVVERLTIFECYIKINSSSTLIINLQINKTRKDLKSCQVLLSNDYFKEILNQQMEIEVWNSPTLPRY